MSAIAGRLLVRLTGGQSWRASFVVAVATGLTISSVLATPATAVPVRTDVPLSCSSYDLRTPGDRLPRHGVVAVQATPSGTPYYETYIIGNDGQRFWITIDTVVTAPIVDTWQNGTDCSGLEYSRNAWAVAPNGRVYTGNGYSGPPANHYGDASNLPLNKPIVGMSPTSTGQGYWLVATDGGIFTYGDAQFFGSTGDIRLNKPIVGMSVTPTGKGYWLVAADGGIFCFGDAQFFGSTGNLRLNRPVIGMMATPSGRGYSLVASDGGIFTFGDAAFKGSMGAMSIPAPIIGMIPWGGGYLLVGHDGSTYPFP